MPTTAARIARRRDEYRNLARGLVESSTHEHRGRDCGEPSEAKVKIAAKIAGRGLDDVLIRFLEADKPVTRCGNAPLSMPKTGLEKLGQALL